MFRTTQTGGYKDHPRVGGEKVAAALVYTGGTGSPPHGRGKDPTGICGKDLPGITPARAGKRAGTNTLLADT